MAACTSQAISGLTRKIPVGLTEMEHTGCNRLHVGHRKSCPRFRKADVPDSNMDRFGCLWSEA